jgi:rhamnopyranosyl-N-acetylglucosaminyl-diphospho-decaprenol beta-1,3/1,4-galactofuranosyltransferase
MAVAHGQLAVVVVTFNRCKELAATLDALFRIAQDFTHLIVVDNASTDDTASVLDDSQMRFGEKLIICRSEKNLGGAGGFHLGMKTASLLPVDWIWISDDDAIPTQTCLSQLVERAESTDNVYGGVAVMADSPDEELCWPASVVLHKGHTQFRLVKYRGELEASQEVLMLPFLGFMISKRKVIEIGLPDSAYFISGDDAEYCIRARHSGSKIVQVRDSVVVHPRISRYIVRILGKEFYCLNMQPWRRYYEVRNRIWNARLSNGFAGAVISTLTHLLRFTLTLMYENDVAGQPGAYFRGIRDGLLTHPGRESTSFKPAPPL